MLARVFRSPRQQQFWRGSTAARECGVLHFLDSSSISGSAFHFRSNGRYGTGSFGAVSLLVGCPVIGAVMQQTFAFYGWVHTGGI